MQETDESTNIQDKQTQQHKGMEQAEDVLPTTDSITAVDQARKPSLSEQEITGMPMSTQKIEKVKWDNLLLRKLDIWVTKTQMQSHLPTSMSQ